MALKPKGILALAALVVVGLAASAGTLLAADPPAQVAKPVASISIVPVAANPADPNVITVTLPDGKATAKVGTTGLDNVPINVPVTLSGSAIDPKVPVAKYAWTLSKPTASKASLTTSSEAVVKFTPDVSGMYKVDLVLSNEAGSSDMDSVQIHAGEYIGAGFGNCFQCHPQKTQEWSETPHANLFREEINGAENPRLAEYAFGNEGCIRCHTTGYYPGTKNGGFGDVWAATGWQMPPLKDVQNISKDNFAAMPVALQNMATIGCEDCHGPAKDHVTTGGPMAASLDSGVCNQCHDGSAKHSKGTALSNAGHSDATAQAWTYPVGPSRQDCVRCHSGAGFITFLKNPTSPATWDNSMQTLTCAVCHDSHSEANDWQLRITGKPVEAVGLTKDFGLSATCVECHNARTTAADAKNASFPHYSAAGEMLADVGGVTYGQNVPNSPHGMVVGTTPMANPDPSAEIVPLFGRDAPGPCVVCHMWPLLADSKDPNWAKVGGHSFNTVSPDGTFEYTASCQQCHQGIKDFNLQASADFDGNGKAQGVQDEVAGLLTTLQKAIGDSGIKPVQGHPYFDQTNQANWTEKQKNAIYNYQFVRGPEGADGKASAIHNFERSVALLQLSYKDLTDKDVPNATLLK